jgi:hypothetical protein
VWGNLKPLLFWAGDTIDTFVHDGVKKESEKKSEALESKGRGVSEKRVRSRVESVGLGSVVDPFSRTRADGVRDTRYAM